MFVGISALPFLRLRARALEEEGKVTMQGESDQETAPQNNAPSNPFLSLLNGLGVFSSGVLGALFALTQTEKKAAEATLESMKAKIKEKEDAIVLLGKNFEIKLQNEQEERSKQIRRANEEQQSLMNQLNATNNTLTSLGNELHDQKLLTGELNEQIYSFQTSLMKSEETKKQLDEKLKEKLNEIEALQNRMALLSSEIQEKEDNILNFSSVLSEKDLVLRNLNSSYKQMEEELAEAKLTIGNCEDELLGNQKELKSKNLALDDLNERVSSLIVERDNYNRKLVTIQEQYSDLKKTSEQKVALDSTILQEREHQIQKLEDELHSALNEATGSRVIISDLTREKDELGKILEMELDNAKTLKQKLKATEEELAASRTESSDLAKQLKQSEKLCVELEAQVLGAQSEFAQARESLQRSLDESKLSSQLLASELTSTQELLKKSKDELQIVSSDLASATENRDSLQEELLHAREEAKNIAHDLKEEKKVIASLNKELQLLEKQILKDKELRKSLEEVLEEATKSLDEMNRKAFDLSGDLDMANSRISDLEQEKDKLYMSLSEQKNISQGARENMEDAHNLLMRFGTERETLEKRGKKLEEELMAAKGEILRLRSQINSTRMHVNDQHPPKGFGEGEGNAAVYVKKSGRRRKSNPE